MSEPLAQALRIATGEPVETIDGAPIRIDARTLCLHGDTPGAVDVARAVRSALEAAGIRVTPFA